MSTLQATNLKHGSSASNNLVLDANGNVTAAGTVAMATPFAMRNKIINGDFRVAQRGTSFSGTSTEYTVDRWRFLNAGVSASKTVSQQTVTQGQTDFPPDTINFVNVSAGSVSGTGFASFDQPIEDVRTLAGQTVTVSFWAKGSTAGTVKISIFNYFGGGGTATTSADTVTGSVSITTSWARYSVTLSVPNFSGKTLGSGHANDIHFVLYADSTQFMGAASYTGTLSLANVQLEVGSVATPFERRPYGLELALCQRYYEQDEVPMDGSPKISTGGLVQTSTFMIYPFKVTKRTTPTCTLTQVSNIDNSNGTLSIQQVSSGAMRVAIGIANTSFFYSVANIRYTSSAEL